MPLLLAVLLRCCEGAGVAGAELCLSVVVRPWSSPFGCVCQCRRAGRRGGQLPGAAPSQMEARVAPGQDLTGAAMATFLYDRLVAEEAG